MVACAQVQTEKPYIIVKHDAEIEVDGVIKKVKANEKIEVEDEKTIKVSADGKASLVIFNTKGLKNNEVNLPDLSETSMNEKLIQSLNKRLDQLMPQIQEVQQMILNEDYNNAISKVRDLKNIYPGLAYLSFLESACYKVQGRDSEALRVLNEGLSINPESTEGKSLYRSLSGREVR